MAETHSPIVGVVRGLAAIIQLGSAVLVLAPALAGTALEHFGVDDPPPAGWLRLAGVVAFVLATAVRIALPGARRANRERAWAELAQATGGEFTVEKRGGGAAWSSGGPTVRWHMDGVGVTLAQVRSTESSGATRVGASYPSEKALSFSILPNNVLTRALTSQKVVGALQSGIRSGNREGAELVRAEAVRQIGILSGASVSLGDPRLDGQILVKSDLAALSRYVLTGGGVTERMVALGQVTKGWTLQLWTVDGRGELMLDLQASGSSPEAVRAAKDLVDSVLGSLKHNGVIADVIAGSDHPRRRAV